MPNHVLALGWTAEEWNPFEKAIREVFPADTTVDHRPTRELNAADVLHAELIVVSVPHQAEQHRNFREWLVGQIDRYPYVPFVVVGQINRFPKAFHAIKAARYLAADIRPKHLAKQAVEVVGAAWWHGVRAFDQPLLVVDGSGRIMRSNQAGRERFGADVVGQPYLERVEARPAGTAFTSLPDHPIAKALHVSAAARSTFAAPEGCSEYWEYLAASDGPPIRAQLVCVPVLGLRNEVRAVCVLFVEMTRWVRVFQSATQLASAESLDDLSECIVAAVHDPATGLGYERVRLYLQTPDGAALKGKASRGFRAAWDRKDGFPERHFGADRETYFRESFALPLAEDEASQQLVARRFPMLCISRPDPAPPRTLEADTRPDRTYLSWAFFRRTYDDETDGPVARWIDVPLIVPGGGDNGELLGKLTVDRLARSPDGGHDDQSDRLGPRDVADLALFALVAAGAIAALRRRKHLAKGFEVLQQTGMTIADVMARGLSERGVLPPSGAPVDEGFERVLAAGDNDEVVSVVGINDRARGAGP